MISAEHMLWDAHRSAGRARADLHAFLSSPRMRTLNRRLAEATRASGMMSAQHAVEQMQTFAATYKRASIPARQLTIGGKR